MNTVNTLPYSSSFSLSITKKCLHHHPHNKTPQLSFSTRRRSRNLRKNPTTNPNNNNNKNKNKNPIIAPSIDNQNVNLVLDVDQLSSMAASKLNLFLSSGKEALTDLQTLITVDDNRRVVVSCRKSTVHFVGSLLILGYVIAFAFRVLVELGLGFKRRFGAKQNVVVRRDRSLGGKEVIVGTMEMKKKNTNKESFNVLDNPLSPGPGPGLGLDTSERDLRNYRVSRRDKLPKWWPVSVANRVLVVNQQEYQREANRLIRALMDYRTSGKDIMEDDIIQLRRICRTSGVRVSIDTTNTRDAFYRASIDFVLNVCSSAPSLSSSVEIDGEDARQFIAGLAENIGLENIRAARMVSAAVAARTRSRFLQAWALELRGKHSEAALELSQICLVFRTFPPEESSPEMEMVARGLEKLLKVEQREFLMNMIVGVCCEESQRSAAEALGLMFFSKGVGEQQENKYT